LTTYRIYDVATATMQPALQQLQQKLLMLVS